MRILRMKATFGCLEEAELLLEPGLNVLQLPNEQGKSTWAAFLLAMFYGVDTAQRAAKGRLPEKMRYQPWSGKAMTGLLELEHEGRVLVLQRTASRTKPMGQLQVYEKETGLRLTDVTAENCGVYFLGVERSVFQRSAFLTGRELAVTRDEALAQRLENLAASGDAGENYLSASARLKQWKNRIRYHHTGLLPEAEARLEVVSARLQEMETLSGREIPSAEALTRAVETWRKRSLRRTCLLLALALGSGLALTAGCLLLDWPWWILLILFFWVAVFLKESRKNKEMTRVVVEKSQKALAMQARMEALGDRDALKKEQEALTARTQALLQKEQALALAQEALEEASRLQAQVYAPRLTAMAGVYLSRLTGGKYDGLVLEQDFILQVRERETGLTRPLGVLSSGTGDQVWLALRLAMTKLLLPEGTPIWLDDALLTFDDHRTDLALDVLSKEGRQVVVMCCK